MSQKKKGLKETISLKNVIKFSESIESLYDKKMDRDSLNSRVNELKIEMFGDNLKIYHWNISKILQEVYEHQICVT